MNQSIIVVSGLPRSGTSMMMRMLEAGGLGVLVDNIRKPDEDNPAGYYEFEKVKNIRDDVSWFSAARGKAVKIVSQLLYQLPEEENYKIIFMERDIHEILSSQAKMLLRRGNTETVDAVKMKGIFIKHLAEVSKWLNAKTNMDSLYISYNDILTNNDANIRLIKQFLDVSIDESKMQQCIENGLYRNNKS